MTHSLTAPLVDSSIFEQGKNNKWKKLTIKNSFLLKKIRQHPCNEPFFVKPNHLWHQLVFRCLGNGRGYSTRQISNNDDPVSWPIRVCVCAVPMCVCNIIFLKIEDACGLGPDLELPPELTRVIVIMIITRNWVDRVPAWIEKVKQQVGRGTSLGIVPPYGQRA